MTRQHASPTAQGPKALTINDDRADEMMIIISIATVDAVLWWVLSLDLPLSRFDPVILIVLGPAIALLCLCLFLISRLRKSCTRLWRSGGNIRIETTGLFGGNRQSGEFPLRTFSHVSVPTSSPFSVWRAMLIPLMNRNIPLCLHFADGQILTLGRYMQPKGAKVQTDAARLRAFLSMPPSAEVPQ